MGQALTFANPLHHGLAGLPLQRREFVSTIGVSV